MTSNAAVDGRALRDLIEASTIAPAVRRVSAHADPAADAASATARRTSLTPPEVSSAPSSAPAERTTPAELATQVAVRAPTVVVATAAPAPQRPATPVAAGGGGFDNPAQLARGDRPPATPPRETTPAAAAAPVFSPTGSDVPDSAGAEASSIGAGAPPKRRKPETATPLAQVAVPRARPVPLQPVALAPPAPDAAALGEGASPLDMSGTVVGIAGAAAVAVAVGGGGGDSADASADDAFAHRLAATSTPTAVLGSAGVRRSAAATPVPVTTPAPRTAPAVAASGAVRIAAPLEVPDVHDTSAVGHAAIDALTDESECADDNYRPEQRHVRHPSGVAVGAFVALAPAEDDGTCAASSTGGARRHERAAGGRGGELLTESRILGPLFAAHTGVSTVLGGLCVIGPHRSLLLATTLLIVAPFIMLAGGVFPHLTAGLIFVDVAFFVLTLFFLFRTALTDPGFVSKRISAAEHRRAASMPAAASAADVAAVADGDDVLPAEQNVTLFWSSRGDRCVEASLGAGGGGVVIDDAVPASPARERAESLRVAHRIVKARCGGDPAADGHDGGGSPAPDPHDSETVHRFPVRVRFCHTCHRYKAPRTFHCDACGACVDGFDHHCPFTGTCIGAGNYASFLAFMLCLETFIVLALVSVIAGPVMLSDGSGGSLCLNDAMTRMGWMPVVLLLLIYALSTPVTALFIMHAYLVVVGQTTVEHLRERYVFDPNPFDRGAWRNVLRALGAADPAALTATYDRFIVEHALQNRGR